MRLLVILFMLFTFDSPAVLGESIPLGETARNLESLGSHATVFVDEAEQLSFEEVARHLPLATSIDQRESIYFILGWCFPAISYISIGIYNEFGIMKYFMVDIGWSHFVEAMFCSVAQGQIYKK